MTPYGDIALTDGTEFALLQQEILLWAATPIGEDIDPKCGSILHNYVLNKNTITNLRKLEMELQENMEYNFPNHTISNVRVISVYDETTDTNGIAVSALFDDDEIAFVGDAAGLLEITTALRKTLGTLEYITNSKA